jgi:hypothetical protein
VKIYIKTYGCQMNERDSEALAGMLVAKGHQIVPDEEISDLVQGLHGFAESARLRGERHRRDPEGGGLEHRTQRSRVQNVDAEIHAPVDAGDHKVKFHF